MSREVVVVEGLRTPYAKAGTLLKDVPAQELARIVITELLARTGLEPSELDHVIFGNIAQPPDAVNLARVAALLAGVPRRVPGVTVNRLCGSGLQSIVDAWYRIASGNADAIIAAGPEASEALQQSQLRQALDQGAVDGPVGPDDDFGGFEPYGQRLLVRGDQEVVRSEVLGDELPGNTFNRLEKGDLHGWVLC